MLMVDHEIKKGMEDGAITISPFKAWRLQDNAYDVTLGEWLWRRRYRNGAPAGVMALDRQNWADKPEKIVDWFDLMPHELVLVHTDEIIGGTVAADGSYAVSTAMAAKSTTARYGLSVCMCAGLGNVGFVNRWAIELRNNTLDVLRIPCKAELAQIIFHKTAVPQRLYGGAGRYSPVGVPPTQWLPEDILPRRPIT